MTRIDYSDAEIMSRSRGRADGCRSDAGPLAPQGCPVAIRQRAAFEKEGNPLTPMGRRGSPEEVARAALFLAFKATFTTAQEDIMTFINLSLGQPVARAQNTITGELGGVGARFIMDGGPAQGRFSLVEHPIVPRGLAAPMHLHTREDEYSFVLQGRWGFQLGSEVVYAEAGDLVYKPRNVWHTFWNATAEPARLLEIISPAGFEQFFVELAALMGSDPDDLDAVAALGAKYGVETDHGSTARLVAEHGLVAARIR